MHSKTFNFYKIVIDAHFARLTKILPSQNFQDLFFFFPRIISYNSSTIKQWNTPALPTKFLSFGQSSNVIVISKSQQ